MTNRRAYAILKARVVVGISRMGKPFMQGHTELEIMSTKVAGVSLSQTHRTKQSENLISLIRTGNQPEE